MPPTITPNLGMRLPDVGFDENTWGGDDGLNHDLSLIDAVFNAGGAGTSVGLKVGTGKTLDARLGTLLATADRLILADGVAPTKTGRMLVDLVPVGTQVDWHLPPIADVLVGVAQAQTLTNKTLTSPHMTTIEGSGGTLTLPAGPDTLVGRDTVDTLTNKTLTNPVINGATLGAATATTLSADTFTTTAANVNAQTGTSYALQNSDNGKTITMSNAAASLVSVPTGLTAGFCCTIIQLGAGQVTIGGAAALRGRNGFKLAGQNAVAGLLYILANTYVVGGDVVV